MLINVPALFLGVYTTNCLIFMFLKLFYASIANSRHYVVRLYIWPSVVCVPLFRATRSVLGEVLSMKLAIDIHHIIAEKGPNFRKIL